MAKSALETASEDVGVAYGAHVLAAANALAAAAPNHATFLRLWIGIGEFATSGMLVANEPDAGPERHVQPIEETKKE